MDVATTVKDGKPLTVNSLRQVFYHYPADGRPCILTVLEAKPPPRHAH